jgi:hypothetical protein
MQTTSTHSPPFSLFALFAIVAAASGCLALTNAHFLAAIPFLLFYVFTLAGSRIRDGLKRGLIWGAVVGSLAFVFVAEYVASVIGIQGDYASVLDFTRRYAIPVGGFLGGTIGYLYASRPRRTFAG